MRRPAAAGWLDRVAAMVASWSRSRAAERAFARGEYLRPMHQKWVLYRAVRRLVDSTATRSEGRGRGMRHSRPTRALLAAALALISALLLGVAGLSAHAGARSPD